MARVIIASFGAGSAPLQCGVLRDCMYMYLGAGDSGS